MDLIREREDSDGLTANGQMRPVCRLNVCGDEVARAGMRIAVADVFDSDLSEDGCCRFFDAGAPALPDGLVDFACERRAIRANRLVLNVVFYLILFYFRLI